MALAAEIYQKLQDPKALVDLYVSVRRWDDAFAVAERHPEIKQVCVCVCVCVCVWSFVSLYILYINIFIIYLYLRTAFAPPSYSPPMHTHTHIYIYIYIYMQSPAGDLSPIRAMAG